MGSKRGAANLAKFNDERSAHVLPLLTHELQLCRKRKLEFKTPGLLAAYLSDRLQVHRTTLTRNAKYKALILAHIAGQPGAVARAPDSTEDPALLQAKLAAAKLEASELREELRAVGARTAHAEGSGESKSSREGELAFADLAVVMAALLTRLQDFLHLDFEKRELHDLAARPSERLVAGPDRVGRFCAWIEQNQALPHLQQLKQLSSAKGKSRG